MFFQTRSVLLDYGINSKKVWKQLNKYVIIEDGEIEDTDRAIEILLKITDAIQSKMMTWLKSSNSYECFLRLYWIFDEIHSRYLKEKEARVKIAGNRIFDEELSEVFAENKNIMRYMIDACNIWIENCLLLQHDVDIRTINIKKMFILDDDLFIDLYLYGMASHTLSLLMLSKNKEMKCPYYGVDFQSTKNVPIEPIKYHPFIYFDTVITGNQNVLSPVPLTAEANQTDFGKGFKSETGVEFLLFLAGIHSFQIDKLREDDKSLRIISKNEFLDYVGCCTNPSIDGASFFNSFVLTKEKLEKHLRRDEEIIWIVGANKFRHELRPFVCLDDNNVIISYGALEQAKQLWVSYQSNGGMCYTSPSKMDSIKESLDRKNTELSDVLVQKIRDELRLRYSPDVDLIDVRYDRIFGEKEIDYGDYDIVFYSDRVKELFLVEAKYFSDSLNASGTVTDYEKMYQKNGYYDHCRHRYDLVLSEKEKLKQFLNAEGNIKIHMLFISSKPLEMDLKDEDGIVTILSLGLFDMYLDGKLLDGETGEVIKTDWSI